VKNATILKTGIVGAIVAALCRFTPVLIVLLSALGLSAWLGWLDYVLLPALAAFVGMIAYGLWRNRRASAGGNGHPY